MQFEPKLLEASTVYKLLTGTIIPRPIGWISTISENGINNLAPFSYFNMVSHDPPCVLFSTGFENKNYKDTLKNVLENHQFVVNLVTEDIVEHMNATAQSVEHEVDEFELANLTPIDSELIKPKRVAESLITLECKMIHHHFIENDQNGGCCMVVGEIIMMHYDDKVLLDNYKINLDEFKPVARLAGNNYGKLGEIFQIKRQ